MPVGLERGSDEGALYMEDVKKIVNHFGYFVACYGSGDIKIGDTIEFPPDVISQPFVVTSRATREEWNEQWNFVGKPIGKTVSDIFYRLSTD